MSRCMVDEHVSASASSGPQSARGSVLFDVRKEHHLALTHAALAAVNLAGRHELVTQSLQSGG